MIRTRVGYSGGTAKDPTYRQMADHTETVQVDYDPRQVSYEDLLALFWSAHDPTQKTRGRQYMSAIFFHNPAQQALARTGADRETANRGRAVDTKILPATKFYLAEFYHQKYFLQQDRIVMGKMRAAYPIDRDLIDATAAARLNGYLGGHGTTEQLRGELDSLGFTGAIREYLMEKVGK